MPILLLFFERRAPTATACHPLGQGLEVQDRQCLTSIKQLREYNSSFLCLTEDYIDSTREEHSNGEKGRGAETQMVTRR